MNLQLFLMILPLTIISPILGQEDTSTIYKNLQTKKVYNVSLGYQHKGNRVNYSVNNKMVSKTIYDKYDSFSGNYESCIPCKLKIYDTNNQLHREGIYYTDCVVGWFRVFHPNGKLKISGRMLENPTDNWANLWERTYCSVPQSRWRYYDSGGNFLYEEYWNKGNFISQIPEQKKSEIWKFDLVLNGISIDTQTIMQEEINQLTIIPRFKNQTTEKTKIKIRLFIQETSQGFSVDKTFNEASFNRLDIKKMLKGLKTTDKSSFKYQLMVYNHNDLVEGYNLRVK